jgi:hypothetical protein
MPALPAFINPAALTRPRLLDGAALPLPAVSHVLAMLAISTPEARYAGLDDVLAACTRESLAEFAWDLFQAWLHVEGPPKEQWAFRALGLLGDDESARRLTPLLRQWPSEGAFARATTGLEMLAAIGTDVALMHLNGIAQKVKSKALQDRAAAGIEAIAAKRGLSTEQLADRLAPDLGLDEQGMMPLDFGPRRFTVGFDVQLKPCVRDADGARLKDLPKPLKTDDAALAEQAAERFKLLKKDARTVVSQQLARFELAMSTRRRWTAADFRRLIVEHPLLRHLAQRLLWGAYDGAALGACFRVAEDLSYADAEDRAWTLTDRVEVGIVHPLELDDAAKTAFGQLFADYEILAPFPQLGRETYTLTAAEAQLTRLPRLHGRQASSASLRGLENKGWRRSRGGRGMYALERPFPGGLSAMLDLDHWLDVGDWNNDTPHALQDVVLWRDDDERAAAPAFGTLDPILVSELLRDLELMQ